IRCIDALPDRWWPAVAAITAVLIDDPIAAERAAQLCEPVRDARAAAARDGLADPAIRAAALGCVELVATRCPPPLKADVEAYAELLHRGHTPGDELEAAIRADGPLAALEA